MPFGYLLTEMIEKAWVSLVARATACGSYGGRCRHLSLRVKQIELSVVVPVSSCACLMRPGGVRRHTEH